MNNEWLKMCREGVREQVRQELTEEIREKVEKEFAERFGEAFNAQLADQKERHKQKLDRVGEIIKKLRQKKTVVKEDAPEKDAPEQYTENYVGLVHPCNMGAKKMSIHQGTPPKSALGEALATIQKLQKELDEQKEELENEYNHTLEQSYQEWYELLLQERQKNETLEIKLYEEYEGKLAEIKEFIITKVDEFLDAQWKELTEAGDEKAAELLKKWRAAFPSKEMVEIAICGKDYGKQETVSELKGNIKVLEAKNIRIAADNARLREQIRLLEAKERRGQKIDTTSEYPQ